MLVIMQCINLAKPSGGQEIAILHVVEMDVTSALHRRGSAMHDHNPLHSFMFDSQGQLLFANKAASKACQSHSASSGAYPFPCPGPLNLCQASTQ